MSIITKAIFEKGLLYSDYRKQVFSWLSQGKTSGQNHSSDLLEYTYLNDKRMDRIEKTQGLNETLKNSLMKVKSKQHWLVLVEAWCGDVAQNLPIMAKMADLSDNIELRMLFRDEHPDIIDRYNTEGARSIPKLIILDENFVELATWGPRPHPVQSMLNDYKSNPDETYQDYAKKAHRWYAKDKTITLQKELTELIDRLTIDHQKVA